MPDKIQNNVVPCADDSSVFSAFKDRQLRVTVASSLNEVLLHIKAWADNWNVMFLLNARIYTKVERCRNRPPLTHNFMNTILSEKWKRWNSWAPVVMDTLSRQDGQGCKKAAWPPEKSFTLFEPKPAGFDLKEHGKVQY